ncbi:MAG: Rpp14/Pop5 family protein [archaeon]|nr:hypothetical protein [Nanoarchaeota archaeon]
MKPLPSLKEKKRYVVIQIIADKEFTFKEIEEVFKTALGDFLGTLGLSKAVIMILKEKFNPDTQSIIIKVNNKYVNELKSALILIKKIKTTPVVIKSLAVSGTLKKASTYLKL